MTNKIDWNSVSNFKPHEFVENPDLFAHPDLIYTLQDIREIQPDCRIYPSPVTGALARFSGSETSQHYVGPKNAPVRKSTALDFFMEGIPINNIAIISSHPKVKGLGIYLDGIGVDGKHWVRFHMDIREEGWRKHVPLIWIVDKELDIETKKMIDVTYYPQNTNDWELFKKDALYRKRFKR